jgi:RND family efflux transporter MFP subunit
MNVKYVLPLAVLALVVVAGCEAPKKGKRLTEIDRLPHVETITPEYMAREETVELLATVESLERARLCAQVPGEVKNLPDEIDIGRPIFKGKPLITLDIPAIRAEKANKDALLALAKNQLEMAREAEKVAIQDVEEARAQQARYQADLEYRDLALKRTRELVNKGTLQPQLLEEAELQRNSARAALQAATVTIQGKTAKLQAAKADLKVASSRIAVAKADVALLKTKIDFATIKAPFDGVITRRWVNSGDVIRDSTQPLLTVMRTDVMRIVVDIPERYVDQIRARLGESPKGAPNRVRVKILNYQAEEPITRMAVSVNMVTRLMRAEIHVKNSDKHPLKAGMTGTATIVLNEARNKRLTVPSTALVRVGDQIRVYYLDETRRQKPAQADGDAEEVTIGKVHSVPVTIGLDDGQTVEITKGLSGMEMVIAKGNGVVREGETAIAVPVRELKHE